MNNTRELIIFFCGVAAGLLWVIAGAVLGAFVGRCIHTCREDYAARMRESDPITHIHKGKSAHGGNHAGTDGAQL